jgi:hypothetical protein
MTYHENRARTKALLDLSRIPLRGRRTVKEKKGVSNRRCNQHFYEVRPRKDKRGFDLISDALPFGALSFLIAGRQMMRP